MISKLIAFVGKRSAWCGVAGIATGFATFLVDLAMAWSLQRFFVAAGLISSGAGETYFYPLQPAITEASFLIVTGFFRAAVMWVNGLINGICQTGIETEKRKQIVSWALASGKEPVGTVTTLINDITIGSAAAISGIFYVISRLVLLGGLFVVMCTYSLSITAFVLATIIIIAPLQMLIDRRISAAAKTIQTSLADAVDGVSSAVKNALFIKLHDLERNTTAGITSRIDSYGQASKAYYSLSSLRSAVPQTIGLIAIAIIVLKGASHFEQPAVMVSFLYLVLRMFQILSDMARISGNLRLNYPRIRIMWDWWNKARPDLVAQTPLLTDRNTRPIGFHATGLSFVWPDGTPTGIQKMEFSIPPGSVALIHGPSGIGKTTLMHLLLGLELPSSGKLTWYYDGVEPVEITGRLPSSVAYVGPDPFIVPGTIRDQLTMGGREQVSDAEINDALSLMSADFSSDLEYRITEQGEGLSAGQKQRIALARAVLRKPSLLLLDEATANLDPVTEEKILRNLKERNRDMTIILISHRPHPLLKPDITINLGAAE